jgi:undecaprenyl-diphosphatase
MDSVLEALILGVVQGVAEWLPVSSEGVLTLIQLEFFGRTLASSISVAVWLHLGTLLAAALYFRRELVQLGRALPDWLLRRPDLPEADRRLLDFLFLATIVTGVVGAPLLALSLSLDLLSHWGTAVIGVLLIGTGLIQLVAPRFGRRTIEHLGGKDAGIVGLAQGLAALPGLSRSGLTIAALLLRGYRETEALRISFLMSIPVIFAVQFLLKLLELLKAPDEGIASAWAAAVVGVASAAVVGWLTISALINLAQSLPFWAFAIGLGVLSVAVAFVT